MSSAPDSYVCPDSVTEACDILAEYGHDAKVVAGGQSLSLLLRQDLLNPAVIIDISDLRELNGIDIADGKVRIGATTSYSALKRHEVAETYACLGDAIDVIADEQIRNLGTVGGAVAHADPSLDILPPLLTLDAGLTIIGPDGRREIPFREFYTGYMVTDLGESEVVADIRFDEATASQGSAYEKYATVAGGWATVGVASRVTLSPAGDRIVDAKVALAAVGDTPVEATAADEVLAGSAPNDEVIETAAEQIPDEIDPLEDIAGSPEYKESVAERLGKRSLHSAVDRASGGDPV